MERVNYYVDGYNFYYGLKGIKEKDSDWKKFYWLDFVKLFEHFIGDNQSLGKVLYFTAPPLRENKRMKQNMLFSANKLLNGDRFEYVWGKFFRAI